MRSKKYLEYDDIKQITSPLMNGDRYSSGPIVYRAPDGSLYTENSTRHVLTYGITGSGKSVSGSVTELISDLKAGESVIAIDPKGELYEKTKAHIPENYKKVVINLTEPRKSDRFNVFSLIVDNLTSDSSNDLTSGFEMFESLVETIMDKGNRVRSQDPFWDDSAQIMMRGVFLAAVTFLKKSQISPVSIYDLANSDPAKSENDEDGRRFRYDSSPTLKSRLTRIRNSIKGNGIVAQTARTNMDSICSYDEKVIRDILAVFNSHLGKFIGSGDVRRMHLKDDVNIGEIDGTTPYAVYIIIPIHTHTYDKLAGVIVNQFAQQFFRAANKCPNNTLPIRVDFLLEEFGTIGHTIPIISELITAGRSYGIRVHLIMQSYTQLINLFGPAKANTLASNCGTTIFFRTLDSDTYIHYGALTGVRSIDYGDRIVQEPFITQDTLSSLRTHQAIIMIDNNIFVSTLPIYCDVWPE